MSRDLSCSTRSAAWKRRHPAIHPTILRGPERTIYELMKSLLATGEISVGEAGDCDRDAIVVLAIEAKENTLTLRGEKQTNDEEKGGDVLYQGIAARNFERSFQLADHVQVKGASLENGLLHIDLVREIPEAMKPRAIPIASSSKVLEVQPTKLAA